MPKRKKVLEFIGFLLFAWLIISMPRIIRYIYLKGGRAIIVATLIEEVRCNRGRNNCFKYRYEYKGKTYYGEVFAKTNRSIGQKIEIEISIKDPSTSFLK